MVYRILIAAYLISVSGIAALAQAGQQPAELPPDPLPAMAVPDNYKYERRGRRDPFVNPVPRPIDPEPAVPVVRPPGLRGILISEVTIAGVVASPDPEMNRVVLLAPGNRRFFAAPGDALFDGVIKQIQKDGVVFELRSPDREGNNTQTREVVRRVRPTP